MTRFSAPISEQIWNTKYRYKNQDGSPIDLSVQDTWERIATALSSVESDDFMDKNRPYSFKENYKNEFYNALEDFKYLPAGRITSGAGTGRDVTLFNCFVMGTIPDSMEGIFQMLKEAALTMKQGGGIGYDFSTLRPEGALVKGVASDSSGPLSFMDVWDQMCRTIMSAGERRGAMMGTMSCTHPDVIKFIHAKKDPTKLRMFNLSVLVTDDFMEALSNDDDWDLFFVDNQGNKKVYETVKASYIWNEIMKSTYAQAEPGVIFIDRINKANNLYYCETISATNPCVSGDTPILTDTGWVQIVDVVGQQVNVWNGFEFSEVTPKITGHDQNMWTVHLSDGSELRCTSSHKFILQDGSRVEAQNLQLNQALEKSSWPIIDGNDKLNLDYYAQGFFAGDGWVKASTRAQYIGLYGDKKNINHSWNEVSKNTYAIAGGYENTDLSETKEYLYFKKDTFQSKDFVPINAPIQQKREWLAGLADSDGTVTKDGSVQITSKDRNFLLDVKALLNTMGANGNLKPMKTCYRLTISASHVVTLDIPTKRLIQTVPSRDASRFVRVTSVQPSGIEKTVYCFTEPKRHSGVFNGVYTAQCGEQPLPPYGACLLGSINLAKMVMNAFTSEATIDLDLLKSTVASAIRMMDNVVDTSKFPLEEQRIEAKNKRRIGLGVTGLADMLIMMRIIYGSEESLRLIEDVMEFIAVTAYRTSIQLAKEKGSFPLLDKDKFLKSEFIQKMPEDVKEGIENYGIRNALLLSIAPTGTISLYAGNISSGIEPVFANSYTRNVTQKDGITRLPEVVEDYAVTKYREYCVDNNLDFSLDYLPDYFVNAQTLSPIDHLRVQAVCQNWIDSSISKTINLPEDISFEKFGDVYLQAYDLGCKGCTTYRPNDVTGSILQVDPKKEEPVINTDVVTYSRPDILNGSTTKIKWSDSEHAIYITLTYEEDSEGNKQPHEIFINSKNMDHFVWTVGLTRMISAVFRMSENSTFVVEELKAVFDPKGGQWEKGKYVPSILASIGNVIEQFMKDISYLTDENLIIQPTETVDPDVQMTKVPNMCPSCNGTDFKKESGCEVCRGCGYSKCG